MKRTHTVSVRLNQRELAELDARRGRMRRGQYMREVVFGRPPAVVPEINREAWASLGRGLSNLNQIARRLNIGDSVEIEEIRRTIEELRNGLLKAK